MFSLVEIVSSQRILCVTAHAPYVVKETLVVGPHRALERFKIAGLEH
jgi:hypothetical protein